MDEKSTFSALLPLGARRGGKIGPCRRAGTFLFGVLIACALLFSGCTAEQTGGTGTEATDSESKQAEEKGTMTVSDPKYYVGGTSAFAIMHYNRKLNPETNLLETAEGQCVSVTLPVTVGTTIYVKNYGAEDASEDDFLSFETKEGKFLGSVRICEMTKQGDVLSYTPAFEDCAGFRVSASMKAASSIGISFDDLDYYKLYPEKNYISDGTDLTELLRQFDGVELNAGNYTCAECGFKTVLSLRGDGKNTVIRYTGASSEPMFKLLNTENVDIEGIDFVCSTSESVPAEGEYTCIGISGGLNVQITNCRFNGWDKAAVYIKNTSSTTHGKNVKITNCNFEYNHRALWFDVRAEFVQVTACCMTKNAYGCDNRGGNNIFANCMMNDNAIGLYIAGGAKNVNNSHGSATGCQFNHNTDKPVFCDGADYGFMFTGCHFFYGTVDVTGSVGVCFVGCEFGDVVLKDTGSRFNMFSNNYYQHNVTKNVTNPSVVFENNRDITGALVK